MSDSQIFDAARAGDLTKVRASLAAGADVNATDNNGFTPLHCAAMGANSVNEEIIVAVMQALLDAGAPLEAKSKDGRTPLFLAAEFSQTLAPVQLLIDAGADPDVYDGHGNHTVENANAEEVEALLSELTGETASAPIEREEIKMTAAEWNAAKAKLDKVFDALAKAGLVARQNAGTTQSDGFSDCAEEFQSRGGKRAGLHGFCFYTRQDRDRAKQSSYLSLAFWGAPEGQPKDMQRVGDLIVETFETHGFEVNWDGSGETRPEVYLRFDE